MIYRDQNGHPLPIAGIGEGFTLDLTATSDTTDALTAGAYRLCPIGAGCHILIDAGEPEATEEHMYLPEGAREWITVPVGAKLAAIRAGDADGVLSITPIR